MTVVSGNEELRNVGSTLPPTHTIGAEGQLRKVVYHVLSVYSVPGHGTVSFPWLIGLVLAHVQRLQLW